jgi:hypothetical protein
LPEDQFDRVESSIAEARCGVDRDEAALGSAAENIDGRQVTLEQDDRGVVLREPGREPAPALVQARRDQRRELRVTFVELRPGVEQVGRREIPAVLSGAAAYYATRSVKSVLRLTGSRANAFEPPHALINQRLHQRLVWNSTSLCDLLRAAKQIFRNAQRDLGRRLI